MTWAQSRLDDVLGELVGDRDQGGVADDTVQLAQPHERALLGGHAVSSSARDRSRPVCGRSGSRGTGSGQRRSLPGCGLPPVDVGPTRYADGPHRHPQPVYAGDVSGGARERRVGDGTRGGDPQTRASRVGVSTTERPARGSGNTARFGLRAATRGGSAGRSRPGGGLTPDGRRAVPWPGPSRGGRCRMPAPEPARAASRDRVLVSDGGRHPRVPGGPPPVRGDRREQAHVPAQQPPSGQDARLPPADAHPRRSSHPGARRRKGRGRSRPEVAVVLPAAAPPAPSADFAATLRRGARRREPARRRAPARGRCSRGRPRPEAECTMGPDPGARGSASSCRRPSGGAVARTRVKRRLRAPAPRPADRLPAGTRLVVRVLPRGGRGHLRRAGARSTAPSTGCCGPPRWPA